MIISISGKIGSGKDLIGQIIQYLSDNTFNNIPFEKYLEEIKFERPPHSKWEIKKFADKLKNIICLLIGCTREQLEDREFKEKELGEEWRIWYLERGVIRVPKGYFGIFTSEEDIKKFINNNKLNGVKSQTEVLTPRKLLQLLGTECGRNIIHPNIWVNALFADYIANTEWNNYSIGLSSDHPDYLSKKYPNWLITDTRFPNEAEAIKNRNGIVIRVNRFPRAIINNVEYIVGTDGLPEHESETALDNYQFDYVIDNNGTIEDLVEKVKQILIKEKII